jgi:signal transduction histidine kinase
VDNNTYPGDHRILLCVPMRGDSSILSEILAQSSISCSLFTSVRDLVPYIEEKSEAGIITEEMLTSESLGMLKETLSRQPEWSNFPLIIVSTSRGDPSYVWKLIEKAGANAQIQVLERPLYTAELLSAVRVAIQSRQRQYQIRDELKLRRSVEEKLQEESRRKNDFLAILGHELRNPLASLTTALELVHRNPERNRLEWCEQVVGKQVEQLQCLVDDLIDISRITRGQIELRYTTIELGEQMGEAVDVISSLVSKKNQQLRFSPPDTPLYVRADRVRLQQVFVNLLKNASLYTPEGGEIRFSVRIENGKGIISVTDSGIGLGPEQLNVIFEPFLELRPRRETSEPGLGIGLSVVKNLTEMHGGTVDVYSEGPGKGSEFIVRLPLKEASSPEGCWPQGQSRPTIEEPAAGETCPRSILIAEDNRDFAELLKETLNDEGHIVTVIENGKDAVARACRDGPDFVIIDIGLPDMDGYTVAEKIRAEQSSGCSTLIALSGYTEDKDKTGGLFDHYILKGSDVDKLFEILKSG